VVSRSIVSGNTYLPTHDFGLLFSESEFIGCDAAAATTATALPSWDS
jgi:hypothetical protein